ncbi:MAG: efflux RND transporter periplasmic adaptor subunit, partial [Gammaproteobacteria bacterium]
SKRHFLKYIVAAVVVIVVVIVGVFLWRAHLAAQNAHRYQTAEIGYGNVAETVSATGTINPQLIVNVGTQVSGTVQNLYADYNSHVTTGEVLLTLDPTLFKASVAQQQANLASAEATLSYTITNEARVKQLFKEGYGNKQAVDQALEATANAQASVASLKGQLVQAETNLQNTIIRSPVNGTVINREVSLGQTVAASFQTPVLFEIGQDLHKMQIDTTVNEADVGSIKPGQSATFTVAAYPNRIYNGTVKQVRLNSTNTQNVVTYDVVIEVNNADLSLLPGMTANVVVMIQDRRHVLLVPNSALRVHIAGLGGSRGPRGPGGGGFAGGGQRPAGSAGAVGQADASAGHAQEFEVAAPGEQLVYVLGPKGQPQAVRIRLGISDNLNTEVLSGSLRAGEKIITGLFGIEQGPQRSGFFRPF